MSSDIYIIAADKIVDGVGDSRETDGVRRALQRSSLKTAEFEVAPLSLPWNATLPPGCLRSACSPLEAVLIFKELLSANEAQAMVLSGRDFIRSGYEKSRRNKFMEIYGEGETPLTGYTKLAPAFIESIGISREEFRTVCGHIFENYLRTYRSIHPDAALPTVTWFEPVTEFFRGVDCANPSVDFTGCVVFGNSDVADYCTVPESSRIRITGCSLHKSGKDGLDGIGDIIAYNHLEKAYDAACEEARVDFTKRFLANEALLEVYTCYPVVPLAFLLKSRLVAGVSEIPEFLDSYEITITGGLNLSKAPWNNTTLSNLITMVDRLRERTTPNLGGIHGNGSLGYQQGFMILERHE
ncbi:MAG: hypothetical protein JXC33_05280 [Deltaproteobacteria bacterium]|nr:hypothetical protein [Deltaproteobacteria bacterium]